MTTTEQLLQAITDARNGDKKANILVWDYYYPLCYNIALYELRNEEDALEIQVELMDHLIGEDGALYKFDPNKASLHSYNKTVILNWIRNWVKVVQSKRPETVSMEDVSELTLVEALHNQKSSKSSSIQEQRTEDEQLLDRFSETLPGLEKKIFDKIRKGFDREDIRRSFGLTKGTVWYYYHLLRRKAEKFTREHGFTD